MKRTLVLGVGNILQSDDGLGVYIVNRLVESGIDLPDHVEVVDGGTAGFDLLPLMKGKDKIIVVDALRTGDPPGSLYRFTPDQIASAGHGLSLHDVGIGQIIKTLKLLGENPEIQIIGIVPDDIDTLDIAISPAVRETVPRAIELILDAVSDKHSGGYI